MRRYFGVSSLKINAALVEEGYPAIRERFGADQELDLDIDFKNPRFSFGTTDSNVAFSTTVTIGYKLAGGMRYVLYDEMDFYTEFDFSIDQEALFGQIKEMRWTKAGEDTNRDLPVWNDVDMSVAEYKEHWKWLESKSDNFYRTMNNYILQQGIQLPYWNLSYLTKFTFHKHAMLAVVDLYYMNSE